MGKQKNYTLEMGKQEFRNREWGKNEEKLPEKSF